MYNEIPDLDKYIEYGKSLGLAEVEIHEIGIDCYMVKGRIENTAWWAFYVSKDKIKWAIENCWAFAAPQAGYGI